jgi:hypothetical protein
MAAILFNPGIEFVTAKKPGVGVGSESATLRNGVGIARVHMPLAKGKSHKQITKHR